MPSDEETFSRAEEVVRKATKRGLTVGTAESCTGGLVCAAITDVPGSSCALRGGVVSYDAEVKHDVLGVDERIISDPAIGVVSADCAEQMATGARVVLRCDIAVSITGIAGPSGALPGKPVGTVWFGLATPSSVRSECHHFTGNRNEVRMQAVQQALVLLCEGLEEH